MAKKQLIGIVAILLFTFTTMAIAQEETSDANTMYNKFFSDNGVAMTIHIDSSSWPITSLDGKIIIASGDKNLLLDLQSFVESNYYMTGLPGEIKPDNINISIENGLPKIIFRKGEQEIISVTQINSGDTLVIYGTPSPSVINSTKKLVYVTAHYEPDMLRDDPLRKKGEFRLTTVTKNQPDIEIDNQGLKMRIAPAQLNVKSFFGMADSAAKEIDIIADEAVMEVYGSANSIEISSSGRLRLNSSYDRGFRTAGTTELIQTLDTAQEFYDVTPSQCSKLGFVFLPGYGYDYVAKTAEFTGSNGYALGIAVSQNDNYSSSLTEMESFVNASFNAGITPVIRVLGENFQESSLKPIIVAGFIRELRNRTGNNAVYFQIWDKANIIYSANDVFSDPEDYAAYVIELKKDINDSDVKLISASLSQGHAAELGENKRQDSFVYLEELLTFPEFWDSIDYWASNDYSMNSTADTDCMIASEYEYYRGAQVCAMSITGYQWELETIKKATGKSFSVFLTETGNPVQTENLEKTAELIQDLKKDPNVVSALLFAANSWDDWQSSAWFTQENMDLNGFARNISAKMCR